MLLYSISEIKAYQKRKLARLGTNKKKKIRKKNQRNCCWKGSKCNNGRVLKHTRVEKSEDRVEGLSIPRHGLAARGRRPLRFSSVEVGGSRTTPSLRSGEVAVLYESGG